MVLFVVYFRFHLGYQLVDISVSLEGEYFFKMGLVPLYLAQAAAVRQYTEWLAVGGHWCVLCDYRLFT